MSGAPFEIFPGKEGAEETKLGHYSFIINAHLARDCCIIARNFFGAEDSDDDETNPALFSPSVPLSD